MRIVKLGNYERSRDQITRSLYIYLLLMLITSGDVLLFVFSDIYQTYLFKAIKLCYAYRIFLKSCGELGCYTLKNSNFIGLLYGPHSSGFFIQVHFYKVG